LGRQVLAQAVAAGHDVGVVVRDPSRLLASVRRRVAIHTSDLSEQVPADVIRGCDALINCAGYVADGQVFVDLVDRVVSGVESLSAAEQPVCWFLAGAALLDINAGGLRGVDIPQLSATYWPHRKNFERLNRSALVHWRLLCPGPMVDEPPVGLKALRISVDRLPIDAAAPAAVASASPVASSFASIVPQLKVSYADSAALMLANLDRGGLMERRRVGLAAIAGVRVADSKAKPQVEGTER
jgi:hypothetical protein